MNETVSDERQPDQTPDEQEMLILTTEESIWFANFLAEATWEPTEPLRRAATRHRELFGEI